jgi:hypothetical protein
LISCVVTARVVVGPSLMWLSLCRVVVIGGAGGACLAKSAGNQSGGVRAVYLVQGLPGARRVAGSGAFVGCPVSAPGSERSPTGGGGLQCLGGGSGGGGLRGGVSSLGVACPACVLVMWVKPRKRTCLCCGSSSSILPSIAASVAVSRASVLEPWVCGGWMVLAAGGVGFSVPGGPGRHANLFLGSLNLSDAMKSTAACFALGSLMTRL